MLDPDLFKAVVAIAPVTDLGTLREEAQRFTNFAHRRRVHRHAGRMSREGSPARNADAIKAPVLMFHGDHDLNVGDRRIAADGKRAARRGQGVELVVYKGLDHQLDDDRARTEMLRKSDAFLRAAFAGK